jgi:protein SCO1/2
LGLVVAVQLYFYDLNSKPVFSKLISHGTGLDTPVELSLQDSSLDGVLQVDGRWKIVFFGFTECPGICPTTLRALASEYGGLLENRKYVDVVFISVDTDADSPEEASKFATSFDPTFKGVVLKESEVQKIASQFMTVFGESNDPGHRLMHGSHVYLVRDQSIYATFSTPVAAGLLTEDIRSVVLRSRL